jgi:uncharacterized cupredoxin-like copper-binding protein
MSEDNEAPVRRARIARVCMAMILSLLFASCGSEKEEGGLVVTMTSFSFSPRDLTVRAGSEVAIKLRNGEGGTWGPPHDWTLMDAGYQAEPPWTDEDQQHVLVSMSVDPGETETLTFVAPTEPGEYQIVCHITEHLEGGMQGKLIVTP